MREWKWEYYTINMTMLVRIVSYVPNEHYMNFTWHKSIKSFSKKSCAARISTRPHSKYVRKIIRHHISFLRFRIYVRRYILLAYYFNVFAARTTKPAAAAKPIKFVLTIYGNKHKWQWTTATEARTCERQMVYIYFRVMRATKSQNFCVSNTLHRI